MEIGYCRVSTKEQNPDLQLRALKKAGCKTIYTDKDSGAVRKRTYLDRIGNFIFGCPHVLVVEG